MFKMITSDIKRCLTSEGVSSAAAPQKAFTLFFAYGLHAVIVFRFGKFVDSYIDRYSAIILSPALILYQILNFYIQSAYGIFIDKKASIGSGFYIGHFGGIRINHCFIGKNCSVHQQVKIGESVAKDTIEPPKIGNNVWIGSNSKIYNGVTIEDNATVVVGAVVKSDVPPTSLVMGNPARVVNKNYDNSSLTALNY